MRKQTKLVAVLSTAALLAIGASMTSFAATGWAEEDGTWVYYNRDGERATDQWKKSGNNWYWLDSDGEMAIDQLIEDGDNYYYVDINGVMAANQWVAIDNEDAGQDDEPDHYWYYFQANGKALTQGDNDKVSLKTVNGKKYAFDDEGRMLFGWVDEDSAERVDDTDGDGFKEGTYYFGGEDDGAMTVGWLQLDVTYGISTIMQNDCEVIVLHFLYYLLNENRRVLPAVLIRQESGSRLGHHYPIHPCSLQCHTVTENEIRTFLQQRIRRFRIDINKHHDFRHIIQTSCQ